MSLTSCDPHVCDVNGSQGDYYVQATMKSQLRYLRAGIVQKFGENEKCILKLLCREETVMKFYKNIHPIWLSKINYKINERKVNCVHNFIPTQL
jgi:hypothetical protein